jgi:hypothetical protein
MLCLVTIFIKIVVLFFQHFTTTAGTLYLGHTKYTKQNDKELNTLLNDMEMRKGMGQRLTDKLWRVAKI